MASHLTPSIASLPGGNEIAYFDSGPVPGSTSFATLVLLHGCHFNTYGFHHLLPLASQVNLRLVLVQRRDYEGSSLYTDEELAVLQSDNPTTFFANAGGVWADLIHYLVKNTEVHKVSEDGLSGGIAFGGWSLGNAFAQTLFFEGAAIDDEVYAAIEPYISTLILYDPPQAAFGIPTPPHFSHLFDPFHVKDRAEAKRMFRLWVSSYYDHKDKPDAEEFADLDPRVVTEECVFKTWSTAIQDERTENFPMRSDAIVINNTLVKTHLRNMSENALFALNTRRFPRARVSYVYGERSIWMCAFARHEIKERYTKLVEQGQKENIRTFNFIDVAEGNHFTHSEFPEIFLKAVADGIYRK